ncbi:MAG: hypothetical protein ACOX87_08365 [Chloroflexota bacterium]|jgi:hypothetical protein
MGERGRRKFDIDRDEIYEIEKYPEFEDVPELAEETTEPVEVVEETKFFIDPQWYDEQGLVFNIVAQARLCASCSTKLGSFVDERYPVIDPKTKRVTFEYRRVPYAANPLPIIRDCCSRARDYITPDTPLMEAIFRVFLANGNQPMTVSTIREHLLTYLPEMAALRSDFPPQLLEKLIRGDKSYGIREHQLPVAV